MATSTKTLSADAWTLVSSAVSGTMENQTGQLVIYRAAAALPAPTEMVGLTLERDKSVSWSFNPAQNIYARALGQPGGPLVVVEG
ncbi:MAG: hypothetical protein ACRCYW_09250 [Aeromonas sp.]|uniref:hypothetical protein n=1 Tax=Aeromonas sp. TaxID=647 RepID=UPI003F311706